MRDDFQDDPKTIWQDQPIEASTMTLEKIRQKARELRAKTRRELFGSIAMAIFVVAGSGTGILRVHDPGPRLMFALAIIWSLAGQYFLHRGIWSAALPGDAALRTGLEFYRREVEGRGYLFRRVLRWSFGPVVLSLGALILALIGIAKPRGEYVKMMPFCTLIAIWIVAVFVLRSRGQRELQREIDELKVIEKENRR